MITKLYDFIKTFIKNNYKFIAFWVIVLFLVFYKLPYVILSPGGAINLNNRIETDTNYDVSGKFELAYVTMRQGNVLNVLLSFIIPEWDIEKQEEYTIKGYSFDETMEIERLRMKESIDNATIVAARKANINLTILREVPTVIIKYDNADTGIRLMDKIVRVEGQEIKTVTDIQNIIKNYSIGDTLNVQVDRDNKIIDTYAKLINFENEAKIGIGAVTSYDYETSPKISVSSRSTESGPSGGLMLSLAIYNAITEKDISKGKTIIGTGTIDVEGNVGKIDGVKYKLIGAAKNKADIFFCPIENEQEALEVKNKYKLDIEVIAVSTFDDALNALLD